MHQNALTFAGALAVTNLGGELSAGDTFKLFSAPTFTGAFASVILPPLNSALAWDTSALHTAGTIKVVALTPPLITGVQLFGGDIVVTGTGGMPAGAYIVSASTNIALLVAFRVPIATNRFNEARRFAFRNAVSHVERQKFYLLPVP